MLSSLYRWVVEKAYVNTTQYELIECAEPAMCAAQNPDLPDFTTTTKQVVFTEL